MKDNDLHYKQELMRTLSLGDLVTYGMLYMLPIAPFAMYGLLSKASNGMVPLVYLTSVCVMVFTAHSYMVFSAEFPVAGSVYTYARIGINDTAGFFAGWLIFLDYILAPGVLAVVSAVAMNSFAPSVPKGMWILIFIALGTVMNLVGLNFTAKANRLMLWAVLAVLAIDVVSGLVALYGGKGHGHLSFSAFYNPGNFTAAGLATGVLIGSSNYLGFDAITTLGEEIRENDKRLSGYAGLLTLGAIAILFIGQTWIAADLAPGATVESPDTAFYDISRYAGGNSLSYLTSLSTALAWGIPCTIVSQAAITRVIYAMARDRQLPHVLATVSAKTKQPWVANILVSAVSLGVALFFQDHLDELFLFQNFGAFAAYSIVNLSLIFYFAIQRKSARWISHVALPAIGFAICVTLLLAMRHATHVLGLTWLGIGAAYFLVMRFMLHRTPLVSP